MTPGLDDAAGEVVSRVGHSRRSEFLAPDVTSVNLIEPFVGVRDLPFASELIPFVLECGKSVTYRYGTKYAHLKPRDVIFVRDASSNRVVMTAEILEVEEVSFGAIPLATMRA